MPLMKNAKNVAILLFAEAADVSETELLPTTARHIKCFLKI